jgi:hypothetical protein
MAKAMAGERDCGSGEWRWKRGGFFWVARILLVWIGKLTVWSGVDNIFLKKKLYSDLK